MWIFEISLFKDFILLAIHVAVYLANMDTMGVEFSTQQILRKLSTAVFTQETRTFRIVSYIFIYLTIRNFCKIPMIEKVCFFAVLSFI